MFVKMWCNSEVTITVLKNDQGAKREASLNIKEGSRIILEMTD